MKRFFSNLWLILLIVWQSCLPVFAEEIDSATSSGTILIELNQNQEEALRGDTSTGSQILSAEEKEEDDDEFLETPITKTGSQIEEKEEVSGSGSIILNEAPISSGSILLTNTGTNIPNSSGSAAITNSSGSNPLGSTTVETPKTKTLFINEVMINPLEGKEWLEIYNDSEKTLDLSEYQIADASKTRYVFETNSLIESKAFLTLDFYNVFNNSGDKIYLKDSDGITIDQFAYGEPEDSFQTTSKGESLGRSPDGSENWLVFSPQDITKAKANLAYFEIEIPEIITNVSVNSGTVLLNWENLDNTDFKNYQIYQNQTSSGFVLLSEFSENHFEIQNMEKGNLYEYLIKACNTDGNCSAEDKSKKVFIQDFLGLRLSEVFANSVGADTGNEWIEMFYAGSETLALQDFYLEIDGKKKVDLSNLSIGGSGSFLTLNPQDFGITLKNSNSKIILKSNNFESSVDELFYSEANENKSWRRSLVTNQWEENYHPTKNAKNVLWNTVPRAFISIQGKGNTSGVGSLSVNVTAEFSFDTDGDKLTCFWDYGDGSFSDKCNPPSHKYSSGEFDLKLVVTDVLGGTNEVTQHISVKPKRNGANSSIETIPDFKVSAKYSDNIKINEILPNPKGKDTEGEWIEIVNLSDENINLDWWQIDDEEGGSKPYYFPINTWIEPHGFLVLTIQKTGIGFKNSEDQVRLLAPNGKLKDKIEYTEAVEAKSYQRQTDNLWYWLEPTQSKENGVFELSVEKEIEKKEKEMEIFEEESEELVVQNFDFSRIELSEFLPSSSLGDKENEWIELYNSGDEAYDLAGWSLDDEIGKGSKAYVFPQNTIIKPKSFWVLHSKDSKIALNNSTDTVNLINPYGEIQDSFHYQKIKRDYSWAKNSKKRFMLSKFSTKEKQNIIVPVEVKNDFDKDGLSDLDETNFYKTDPNINDTDGDKIPDGFEVYNGMNPLENDSEKKLYLSYLKSKTKVNLEKIDTKQLTIQGTAEPEAFVKIYIHSKLIVGFAQADANGNWSYEIPKSLEQGEHRVEAEVTSKTGLKTQKQTLLKFKLEDNYIPLKYSTKVKITSILPNPKGKDGLNEFFAIQNYDDKAVNLEGWKVLNQKNHKVIFPKVWLQPQEEKHFFYKDTKLSLNNTKGHLILINPQGKRTDFINYNDVQEGEVFTHTGGNINSFKTHKKKYIYKTKTKVYEEKTEIRGLIVSEIKESNSTFWLRTDTNEEIKVQFNSKEYPIFIAKSLFKKGNQLLLGGEYIEENLFLIDDFILLEQAATFAFHSQIQTRSLSDSFLFFGLFALGGGYWFIRLRHSRAGE